MTEQTSDKEGRINATLKEKSAMFEWLRGIALGGSPDWRKAAIAMQELNENVLSRPSLTAQEKINAAPQEATAKASSEVDRETGIGNAKRDGPHPHRTAPGSSNGPAGAAPLP